MFHDSIFVHERLQPLCKGERRDEVDHVSVRVAVEATVSVEITEKEETGLFCLQARRPAEYRGFPWHDAEAGEILAHPVAREGHDEREFRLGDCSGVISNQPVEYIQNRPIPFAETNDQGVLAILPRGYTTVRSDETYEHHPFRVRGQGGRREEIVLDLCNPVPRMRGRNLDIRCVTGNRGVRATEFVSNA